MDREIFVSSGTLIGYALTALSAFVLPVLLWVIYRKRTNAAYYPLIVGIIGFYAISICRAVARYILIGGQGKWMTYFLMALISGVFEEVGRYIIFSKFMSGRNRIDNAVACGIGHGGFEVIMVNGFQGYAVSNFIMGFTYKHFGLEPFIKDGCDPEETLEIVGKIADSGFFGGFFLTCDDIMALAFHIAMSVLVFICAKYACDKLHLFAAIGIHTLIDFIRGFKLGGAIPEGGELFFKLLITIAACYYAYRVYELYKDNRGLSGNE